MRSSPSIVPADRLDRDIYLVLEDFGARAGCAWRETDEADTDLDIILQNLLSGQYAYPVRSGRAAECAINPYFAGVENPAAYRRHGRRAY
ncbi:hypothetical protein IVB34_35455 [Bradyrhizobium sp. 2]|uniref:hypothetical protein n=1 Tax=Bradyrhizobium sp. 2 TaxID=190045 RepID=UPI001FFA6D4E|nr:hypothetical protein [Bradyrhizobium sp. 2]MCK1463512.1 hypothetical protein [Bradyrhizobium sp. 2]